MALTCSCEMFFFWKLVFTKSVLVLQKFIIGTKQILCIVRKVLESTEENFFHIYLICIHKIVV